MPPTGEKKVVVTVTTCLRNDPNLNPKPNLNERRG